MSNERAKQAARTLVSLIAPEWTERSKTGQVIITMNISQGGFGGFELTTVRTHEKICAK